MVVYCGLLCSSRSFDCVLVCRWGVFVSFGDLHCGTDFSGLSFDVVVIGGRGGRVLIGWAGLV